MTQQQFDLSVARYLLKLRCPYFGSALWQLVPRHKPGIGTFSVDARWNLYYDDQVPWTPEEQATVLEHELEHLLRNHPQRQGGRSTIITDGKGMFVSQWNVACDEEINDDIPEDWPLPKDVTHPRNFNHPEGMAAEWYYDNLTFCDGCGGNGQSDCKVHGNSHADCGDGTQSAPGQQPMVEGGCGSASGEQNPRDWEDSPAEAPGLTNIEQEAIRRHVAEEIVKNRGNVPAGLGRWADEFLNPTIPWQKVLRGLVRRAVVVVSGGASDYTWARPSRRSAPPLSLPKPITRKPTVAVYVDTSGSVGQEELSMMLTEIMGIVKHQSQTIRITFVDAKVYETQTASNMAQVKMLKPKGGGGTDMRLCWEHADTLNPRPNIVVVMTDGYTPWPDYPPKDIQSIICLTPQADEDGGVPDWAKVVKIQ